MMNLNHGYWLRPDGVSYWGIDISLHGKRNMLRKITKNIHELPTATKRRMYNWVKFW